jgi:NAD(P)-dependent dehydrogenase (short-subunit alcohol dehydrogenase family)
MARIFVTGSADGLGRNAALALQQAGHDVVLHARSAARAAELRQVVPQGEIVIGDLSVAAETRQVADAVNALGPMDAVIHNAGVYGRGHELSPDGLPTTLAVNTLAPYLLTALMHRPKRLVYLSSGMHRSGTGAFDDLAWRTRRWNATQAYSESKLHVLMLAGALARRWPDVFANAVNPGWVPTRMGGSGAPDDLVKGHETQVWLASSDDPRAKVSGFYWHHLAQQQPVPVALDPAAQDRLLEALAELTGVALPETG